MMKTTHALLHFAVPRVIHMNRSLVLKQITIIEPNFLTGSDVHGHGSWYWYVRQYKNYRAKYLLKSKGKWCFILQMHVNAVITKTTTYSFEQISCTCFLWTFVGLNYFKIHVYTLKENFLIIQKTYTFI